MAILPHGVFHYLKFRPFENISFGDCSRTCTFLLTAGYGVLFSSARDSFSNSRSPWS
jgi:hypothetical protein